MPQMPQMTTKPVNELLAGTVVDEELLDELLEEEIESDPSDFAVLGFNAYSTQL